MKILTEAAIPAEWIWYFSFTPRCSNWRKAQAAVTPTSASNWSGYTEKSRILDSYWTNLLSFLTEPATAATQTSVLWLMQLKRCQLRFLLSFLNMLVDVEKCEKSPQAQCMPAFVLSTLTFLTNVVIYLFTFFFKRNDFILSLINNMYHFFVTVILWHTNWLVIMMKYCCIRTYSIFRISDVISFSVRILAEEFLQHAMFLGEEISSGTGCLVSFTSTCRLTPNVFVVQKCLRARLSFRAIRRRFCPRRGPERTVGDGIRSTCGPFSSAVAWWAKLKAPRTWRLETPSWCAAFTAPEKQTGRMRRIWNVEGMEFVCLNL